MPIRNLIDRVTRWGEAVIDRVQRAITEDWDEPWLDDAPLDEPVWQHHMHVNRDGQPCRPGQACWVESRREVLSS